MELIMGIKKRSDLAKDEKAKVKRCRMCKHWGEITYFGSPNNGFIFRLNRCCKYQKESQVNITEPLVVANVLVNILKKSRKHDRIR